MRQLAIDLVGHGALLKHHHHRTRLTHHRRHVKVHQLFLPQTRRGEVDTIFIDRRTALAHLIDQRQKRRAEGNEGGDAIARQMRGAGPEKGFRFPVGKGDMARGIHQNDRVLNRIQNRHG